MLVRPVLIGRPASPAIGALEDAAAEGAGVERGRGRRINRQLYDEGAGQDDAPVASAIGALEDTAEAPGIDRGRGRRIDGQGFDKRMGAGQARVDGRPAPPAIGALEDAAAEVPA